MKKIIFTIITVFVLIGTHVLAGSPLIHTRFYSAYYLNEKVQYAEQLEFLDGILASYLIDVSVPTDQKLAVINALQWNEKGKNNVETYKMILSRKYSMDISSFKIDKLSGEELLCLGYMMALDKNRKLADALPILEKAKNNNPKSYNSQLIYTLAVAQNYINNSKSCDAWKACNDIRNNLSLVQDFNQDALNIIFEQVDLYKKACD